MLVGSSNLSQAAFEANYEANVAVEIDAKTYLRAQEWIDDIIAEGDV
jgi:phosphatidylserine/phosphatidylglycerophosphate/cardiolipin synthase-like enzyme